MLLCYMPRVPVARLGPPMGPEGTKPRVFAHTPKLAPAMSRIAQTSAADRQLTAPPTMVQAERVTKRRTPLTAHAVMITAGGSPQARVSWSSNYILSLSVGDGARRAELQIDDPLCGACIAGAAAAEHACQQRNSPPSLQSRRRNARASARCAHAWEGADAEGEGG